MEYPIDKNHFETLFDETNIGTALCELIVDSQGKPIDYRFHKINSAFENQSGMKVNSTIGKTIKDVYPDIEQSWIDKFGSVVINNKPISFIDFNHNTNKYYNANAIPLSENKFAIYFEDITAKKRTEKELNEKNKELVIAKEKAEEDKIRYSGLLQNLESGIVVHAPDTSILMNNPKASELLGLTDNQMKGKEAIDPAWKFVTEESKPLPLEDYPVNRIIREKKIIQNQICGIYRPETDDIIWATVNGFPIFDNTGEISEIVISFINITERRQSEKSSIESHRLNAIGEMASSVAHDFNNSLQLMMGNVELIKMESGLSETILKHVNNLESNIKDAASRSISLQKFGDITNHTKNLDLLDLNTICSQTIKQSQPLWKDEIEKEGFKITINADYGETPKIHFNKGALNSVIYNLIKNSIEAMPEGGTIHFQTGVKNEGVFLTCVDSGIGMNEEAKLKIFQPFFTTKGFERGRGLGMSGVYSIIKDANGSIKVNNSEIGKGTTIEITFPISKMEKMEVIEKVAPEKKASLRVLFVDDEALIALYSQKQIQSLGHQCEIGESGADALSTLSKIEFDVVITDIGMPEMNGWQLVSTIREKYGNAIKIVMASGWEIEEKELKKNNVNYFLKKPYTALEIKKALSKIQE